MKRFAWPLQPLLDLKIQQEKLLRAEVYALAQNVIFHRSQIAQHRSGLGTKLADIAKLELSVRLAGQENFAKYSRAIEKKIQTLTEQLDALETQRNEKIQQLVQIKTSREALEEKRSEAKADYTKAMGKHEQKQLDEAAHLAIVRQMIETTISKPTHKRRQTG